MGLKCAIHWRHESDFNFDLAQSLLSRGRESELYLSLSAQQYDVSLDQSASAQAYPCIDILKEMLLLEIKRGQDFLVVCFGNTYFLSKQKLYLILNNLKQSGSLLAVRHANIIGTSYKYSPRTPLIDEHVLIFDLRKIEQRKILQMPLIKASHMRPFAGIHAILLSFIETTFRPGDVLNLYSQADHYDAYGQNTGLSSVPFSFCNHHAILTFYPKRQSVVTKVFDSLIVFFGKEISPVEKKLPSHLFIKLPLLERLAYFFFGSINKALMSRVVKRELKKKNDEKPLNKKTQGAV